MVFIIDRSGSMSGLESDTIGGFNSMIGKQKKEGDATVSTVLFDHEISLLHDRVSLDTIREMTDRDYRVGGSTALLDAVGSTIGRIKNLQFRDGKEPDLTLFVIITDGMENSSREYTYNEVKAMIEEQKEKGWDFLFLGANIDVAKEAGRLGISSDNAVEFECSSEGIDEAYGTVAHCMGNARTYGHFEPLGPIGWRDED